MSGPKLEDLTGRQYGKWTVLGFHSWRQNKSQRRAVWLCRCACGTEKPVEGNGLRNGDTHGCFPCSRKNMASWITPPKAVKCCECGCNLTRRTHWKNAKCKECRFKHWDAYKREANRRRITEARRYRIIMHVLGFETFDEALAEMKASPMAFRDRPESTGAKREVTIEARTAKAERRRLLAAYEEGVEVADLAERFGMTADAINAIASRAGIARPTWFGGKRGAA